jgi:predicted metal-dependent enzyme (double-stranded beta helix superfamily)
MNASPYAFSTESICAGEAASVTFHLKAHRENTMSKQSARMERVAEAIGRIRQITATEPDRTALAEVLAEVRKLAADTSLWSSAEFPEPEGDERQARYLISETPEKTYALYLNVMKPGNRIVPHNHTTWACIASVEGVETNYLYRRTDDGSKEGHARLEVAGTVQVGPGTGIALMPHDIHAVQIPGQQTIRHLHLYGRALETLNERVGYDLEQGTCSPMPIGVKTRR